jgi:hypothetical protein
MFEYSNDPASAEWQTSEDSFTTLLLGLGLQPKKSVIRAVMHELMGKDEAGNYAARKCVQWDSGSHSLVCCCLFAPLLLIGWNAFVLLISLEGMPVKHLLVCFFVCLLLLLHTSSWSVCW